MRKMILKKVALFGTIVMLLGCNNNHETDVSIFEGKLTKQFTTFFEGFGDTKNDILEHVGVTQRDFIAWSTDSAWSLSSKNQIALGQVRSSIPKPTEKTILQKVISLEEVPVYMNNTYGGTIGGFVSVAADMKKISTMYDTFWGLRLDYKGTKFKENGAGYAVIRFYSPVPQKLTIPFCKEMGGEQPHEWPNTGGGFTASTLSDGGYPEYKFDGYSAPRDGAELYEVTPEGREILRSTYSSDKGWKTNEIGSPAPYKKAQMIRNGLFGDTKSGQVFITTYAMYGGNKYIVRGEVDQYYHLVTNNYYEGAGLKVVEKGVYGIEVPVSEVEIWEESEKL